MGNTEEISSTPSFSHTAWDVHYPNQLKNFFYSFKTPEQAANIAAHIVSYCKLNIPFLELGLNEIFLNAIEHGNLGLDSREKNKTKNLPDWQIAIREKLALPQNLKKDVRVVVEITANYASFEVTDQGVGFDWTTFDMKNPIDIHQKYGRGLLLASTLCFDKLEFIGKGNIIRGLCWK